MICFKCGRQGHKEDACGLEHGVINAAADQSSHDAPHKDIQTTYAERTYGSWMIVKKPSRRNNSRQQAPGARPRGHDNGESGNLRARAEHSPVGPGMEGAQNRDTNRNLPRQ